MAVTDRASFLATLNATINNQVAARDEADWIMLRWANQTTAGKTDIKTRFAAMATQAKADLDALNVWVQAQV